MATLASDWLRYFSTSPLKPLNGIKRNLTGSKISTSSTKFVFFGPIGKTKWPPWPLIGWDIFLFSSETTEWNSMKVKWKQDLHILLLVCVFQADRKNKMAARSLIGWYYLTLMKVDRKQDLNILYQVCGVFFGRSVNKNGHPGWSVKKVAHCTQVHFMWPFGPLVFIFLYYVSTAFI